MASHYRLQAYRSDKLIIETIHSQAFVSFQELEPALDTFSFSMIPLSLFNSEVYRVPSRRF
uniref:Uncharacterized protein n=1 Tax=Oryza brachyantha TaxID=4533 RepID=J3LPM4_ORYBR